MKALGIDIGSQTTKVALLNETDVHSLVRDSGDDAESTARSITDELLKQQEISFDECYIVSTGVGGKSISFATKQKNMATCLARGTHYLFPSVRMAIDMGAESSCVLKISSRGKLTDWVTQDKCASGTGLFLQQMAKLMAMPIEQMAVLSKEATNPAEITSTCAVFAESEVISHVHRDPPTPMPDIVAGIYESVVHRIIALCKRIGIEKDVAMVGGVACNKGLAAILEKALGCEVLVPEQPQTVAALGAAVVAQENIEKASR